EEAEARARRLLDQARSASDAAVAVTPVAAGWQALTEAEYERVKSSALPDRWAAAAAAWDELEQPYRAAYCRWRQAEALVAAGASRTEASATARLAHEVCVGSARSRCGASSSSSPRGRVSTSSARGPRRRAPTTAVHSVSPRARAR